jgi:hypothetical protein
MDTCKIRLQLGHCPSTCQDEPQQMQTVLSRDVIIPQRMLRLKDHKCNLDTLHFISQLHIIRIIGVLHISLANNSKIIIK